MTWNILVIPTSPTVSANLHIEDTAPVLLLPGLHADTTSGPALGSMGWLQVVAFWRTERSAYISMVAGMSLASGRERLPVS